MKALKHIFDFYINSSIHVSLAVVSLSWLTLLEFGSIQDKSILYFTFFASITGYNFVKYFGLARFHHRSLAKWLKEIQIFSFFCFLFMCFYMFRLQFETLIFVVACGVLTFLYAIPVLPKQLFVDNQQNLRSISGLKIYIIALVWSGVTVFLPLVNNGVSLESPEVIVTAVQRFVLVIALTIPFEIRDLQYDSLKLSTIPQQMGVRRTKIMGVLLLMLFFVLGFFKEEVTMKHIVILLVITLTTLLFLLFSKKDQGPYYSGFWVEGIPIFWLLLVLTF